MYVFQKHYTVRLLLIQHVVDDEDKDTVNDGCLLLAIGAAIGAAALLILTIIVATAVCIYHRQPSFTNKRVSPCYTVLFCPLLITEFIHFILLVFDLGLAFTVLLSNGSSPSYHLAPFVLNVTKMFLHYTLLYAVFPKALFSVLYFLSSILPLSLIHISEPTRPY